MGRILSVQKRALSNIQRLQWREADELHSKLLSFSWFLCLQIVRTAIKNYKKFQNIFNLYKFIDRFVQEMNILFVNLKNWFT